MYISKKKFLHELCTELTNYSKIEDGKIIRIHPSSIHVIMQIFEAFFDMKYLTDSLTDEGVEITVEIVEKIVGKYNLDKKSFT